MATSLVNSAHPPGPTYLAFARDGSRVYTGGSDTIVRIWNTNEGTTQEPDSAGEAKEGVTCLAAGHDCWFSGSNDSEVRRYAHASPQQDGLVTNAAGVAIRSLAVDPQGSRIAVTSDETTVKVIELADITNVVLLKGHTKAVRRATWHPSGSLLATCGADGRIVIWDISEGEGKEAKTIEGVIPAVANTESDEFAYDCSVVWHPSGQHFFVATRTHEIISISRNDWSKSSTFSNEDVSGTITALALSPNGVYIASATKSGVFIWSTQTRRLLYRFQDISSPPIQLAFSPSQNLLAWTDLEGAYTRWQDPIPATAPHPIKPSTASSSAGVQKKRARTPTLFDTEADKEFARKDAGGDVDLDEDLGADLDNDDWILDDLGGGMDDDAEDKRTKEGIKEMVSVTKAQPAFQPSSTPLENKKRYLAYNMIGVIEVTDQDTHHIVNVEFHDKSARKSYHFTDHFKYDIASLGERGAAYACQPENEHSAHVTYKPYGTWATQGEWTYELPKGTRVLGVAAGGPPPTKSLREKSDADMQGNGNVVIATSTGELIFLTGTGIERCILSLQGDFVTMVASPEWVFIVTRDGATTMDGSQNLTGRLIQFDDFCVLQKDALPVPKRHTVKWIGVTEEGAPAIYDSAGILNVMPRFRLPFAATWTRALDTNVLDRREGKQESYWPVGVAGETLMCLILKGRQEHPTFPRPLIQELPLKLPFHRQDPKEAPLEEHLAREGMLLDILRDSLGDQLTTDDISRRELALDKELIQLIQNACKNDRLARALDLTKLLHHTASFDMAIKVAGFYHLIGLQEKIEALKDDREETDRLADAREKRRQRARDLTVIPAPRTVFAAVPRQKAFQDFKPPPAKHRPGLERATPVVDTNRNAPRAQPQAMSSQFSEDTAAYGTSFDDSVNDYSFSSPDGKRKRAEEMQPVRDYPSPGMDNASKRRAVDEPVPLVKAGASAGRANPFARKTGTDNNRNPFARSTDVNKALQKSESFFSKVDAAETDKGKRPPAGKAKANTKEKEKKSAGRQTTLFGLPANPQAEKKSVGKKKKASESQVDSQQTEPTDDSETQTMDVTMIESQSVDDEDSQPLADEPAMDALQTEINQDADTENAGSPEPIEWPPSPTHENNTVEVVVG
ncbi:uncharacterized protein C8Q71DRAFT_861980 [Rhodofomes roseus]|uniref:Minichromosome loss protein Mcl1 middle region domain-containing protein n=1 Tax=Rhodofomes roseus TaxID=34475 RepID=A0ABQ8K333_9APHY|nr:uncharacterized protein C8Q71DRAFT_861980 [Rhodofomes roseus]KAH9831247.1 hypothetical protein C8Q71DRAFT_861980 [Rhodofomes roseus]